MSLRRLHHEQPESFAFTPANAEWAERQIAKYPEGRQASAVIPLLWRAQEQEGWISRPIVETVARMLGMAEIRVLEVATFYFMFQLRPVGSVAHVQICGTTPCMLCGSEALVEVCKSRIAAKPHTLSADGKFSWEEVECLGACSNAPMAQIGKDYYEDLDAASFGKLLDAFARGEVPRPGSAKGRFASEPVSGLTSLDVPKVHESNGSVTLATEIGDTVKRIDGTEPTASDLALGRSAGAAEAAPQPEGPAPGEEPAPVAADGEPDRPETPATEAETIGRPEGTDLAEEAGAEPVETGDAAPAPAAAEPAEPVAPSDEDKPELLADARDGGPDDLQKIKGIGPKLESLLHRLGVYHFDQIASWSDREIAWVDYHLEGFNGRILRDDWVAQAKALTADKGDS
ncbi:NADH-quinone oxidoreductase subunit NuoE [Paralimibaculum aggregatum]|uniref:NADH-quinone oxidoreductase subunit NuoE n=1 Tax=Paralimibaculum aggregatum TaxID=3036245 RepID=A0ABQ6LT34_9RHOB|nr:NADH-quinone oxidoreductase subunit E [Limibaculum sp. NKW23]GMG85231.1 NADH-quinone oxidoreductase subunit NuoE [Limibaculum sp. NKW23]